MKEYKVYIGSLSNASKYLEKTEKNLNELAKEGYRIVGVAPYGSNVNIYLERDIPDEE
ncbi:hypothetical protein [uncultured Traorella sp.]|uniref:hypothetical protein n=1 Tax=uncultured Traorella sp. TaxID=1929048 RepID=UPI002600862A|nr:hypothetical protein [uncultured Traorella sp.]